MTINPGDLLMQRAWHNLIVLIIAQALLGAQLPMIFTIGGLAGQTLAPTPCLATLPISMIVLGSALSARLLSGFMQIYGRQAGFQLAATAGAMGAGVSAFGLYLGSFTIYLVGSLLTGVYMSAQGFFRFAATDTAPEAFAPRAISLVMAGGLASAFIALGLLRLTGETGAIPFLYAYATITILNLFGIILFTTLNIPVLPVPTPGNKPEGRNTSQLLRNPTIIVAIICAMVSYALMNLVMTSTSLAMVGCGLNQSEASDVVFSHVLAMYIPSFFTGHLINRFGTAKIIATGLIILMSAGAVALSGIELGNFFAALILLGIGWNFGFIGATTMLTQAHRPEERGRIQGINDLIVFGGVFLASVSSGALMNCSGAVDVRSGWSAVNLAMAPFLILAGGALIWLNMRPKQAEKNS